MDKGDSIMFHKLKSAIRILREEGILSLAKKFLFHILHYPMDFFISQICLFEIRNVGRNYSLDMLIDFTFTRCFKMIKPVQLQCEILKLLMVLSEVKPQSILEIGTANGGTLFLFTRVASEDASIISVDLPLGKFGGGYPKWRVHLYKSFALPNQQIHLIRADSHNEATLEEVKAILNGKKIDFLFIDGDHTYEGVKKDFEMYNPMVKNDGIIAFHDIVSHPPEIGCEVNRFWNEIKSEYEYRELVKDYNQKWAGIGLIKNVKI